MTFSGERLQTRVGDSLPLGHHRLLIKRWQCCRSCGGKVYKGGEELKMLHLPRNPVEGANKSHLLKLTSVDILYQDNNISPRAFEISTGTLKAMQSKA